MMASKFKKGDRVRRTRGSFGNMKQGDVGVITRIDYLSGALEFNDFGDGHEPTYFELIPPFAYGDRVRLTANEQGGYASKGDTGKVIEADSGDRDSLVEFSNGDEWYIPWDIMEAVPAFKVGDRVRVIKDPGYRGPYWRLGVTGVIEKDYGHCLSVLLDNPDPKNPNHGWAFMPDEIEHLAAKDSNPLRIEAGKFYKTRDGRRVLVDRNGVYEDGDDYPWMHDCGRGGYHALDANGKSCIYSDQDDIVAEWPAEEAKTAYKIGDRVRALVDDCDITKDSVYTVNMVDEDPDCDDPIRVTDDAGDGWWLSVGDFEPVADDGAKFKVGDKVRYKTKHPSYGAEYIDGTMTILSIDGGDFGDDVELDYGKGYDQTARLGDIEPITSNTAIVARLDNGQPRPATCPYVHADTAAATAEAKRLAKVNPGVEFAVYERVATAHEHEHEWQRLAAGGEKIAAIKALRAQTGLGLVLAKDAVEGWLKAA